MCDIASQRHRNYSDIRRILGFPYVQGMCAPLLLESLYANAAHERLAPSSTVPFPHIQFRRVSCWIAPHATNA